MIAVLAAMGRYGLAAPMVGIAEALRARGCQCVFVGGEHLLGLARQFGFATVSVPPEAEPAFMPTGWALASAVVAQASAVENAIAMSQPDVVVLDQLVIGGVMAARKTGVPSVVLGIAAWVYPTLEITADGAPKLPRRSLYGDFVRIYNRGAELSGAATIPRRFDAQSPLLGDLFLVRSVPTLMPNPSLLPPQVRFIGHCRTPAPCRDMKLAQWLSELGPGQRLVHVQVGVLNGFRNFLHDLLDVFETRTEAVVASVGPLATAHQRGTRRFRVFSDPAPDEVYQRACLSVSTGHSSPVLGALASGVPCLIVDYGSGAGAVAAAVSEFGAGISLGFREVSYESLEAAVARVIGDDRMRLAALDLQRQFAQIDSFPVAAAVIEAMVHGRAPVAARSSSSQSTPAEGELR